MPEYLDILNDASEEYKASLKKVDPNFHVKYYENLILQQALAEPQTLVPEDPVIFDQLNPIETLGNMANPFAVDQNVDASSS